MGKLGRERNWREPSLVAPSGVSKASKAPLAYLPRLEGVTPPTAPPPPRWGQTLLRDTIPTHFALETVEIHINIV